MEQYCVLCGRFVELTPQREVHTLRQISGDMKEFVCDLCVNEKLNYGTPVRNCLFCDNEEDYILQRNGVERSSSGPIIFSKGRGKPIVCEDDFQQLIEENQDHTLSIEDVLGDEEQLEQPPISLPEVIGKEENHHLEYKETFQYDPYNERQDKSLKANTVKEVAAFGNTEGGVVIIGIDDNIEVQGLRGDYDSIGGGRDEFELQVIDVIRSRIRQTFASQYVDIEFHEIEGQDICAIHVEPSPNALTVDDDEFYIRQSNSTQSLSKNDTIDYLSDRWDI